jgi:hypothetical protein
MQYYKKLKLWSSSGGTFWFSLILRERKNQINSDEGSEHTTTNKIGKITRMVLYLIFFVTI